MSASFSNCTVAAGATSDRGGVCLTVCHPRGSLACSPILSAETARRLAGELSGAANTVDPEPQDDPIRRAVEHVYHELVVADAPWLNRISGPALRIDANGLTQPVESPARDHVAVYLPMHRILVSAEPIALDTRQRKLEEIAAGLTIAKQSGWQLAHIDYLQLLVNRERGRPYFDPEFFRDIPDDWCWSSTGLAGVASAAWFVLAGFGGVDHGLGRRGSGFGLAVRRVGQ